MKGFIVTHNGSEHGRIVAEDGDFVRVLFFEADEEVAIRPETLVRHRLHVGTVCVYGTKGKCTVRRRLPEQEEKPYRYSVEFKSGLRKDLPETELTPVGEPVPEAPLDALISAYFYPIEKFNARDDLSKTWARMLNDGQGVKALLSSRIDLRPHQAYVAGTVLLDHQQRYLLADEVGLGKTIEAGIVIHDLLWHKPDAKVLILCPGTLTQQWFTEMFSKFCGRIFQLPHLRGGRSSSKLDPRYIVSFAQAILGEADILKKDWDLVVIDEAHHLLSSERLYDLARSLSLAAPKLLLLSALPAQHREDEYFRLLALLDPHRYNPKSKKEVAEFSKLFALQPEIGKRIRYIDRRLKEIEEGSDETERVVSMLKDLAASHVLRDDPKLKPLSKGIIQTDEADLAGIPLAPAPGGSASVSGNAAFVKAVRQKLHYVGETYRVNRRILRNRRARLIAEDQILPIARRLQSVPYEAGDLEMEAHAAARTLLRNLAESGLDDVILIPLAKQILNALYVPECLVRLLDLADNPGDAGADSKPLLLDDSLIGYEEWRRQAAALWTASKKHVTEAHLSRLRRVARAWAESDEQNLRSDALAQHLKNLNMIPGSKFIVFAGFPGLADSVCRKLRSFFGAQSIAKFEHSMEGEEKESEVRRFNRERGCWILVTDETAGEGRNFQFAKGVIHFDLPWQASKIEQRIGRLDRLGRQDPEVISHVLVCRGTVGEGLLGCLEKGFKIFERPISGLEFALRGLEEKIVRAAIDEGEEGVLGLSEEVRASAEKERAESEGQEVLDEASNERATAASFRRAQSSPAKDEQLSRSFLVYFKANADNTQGSSAKDRDGDHKVLTFRPRVLEKGFQAILPKGENGSLPDATGTFFRQVAQENPGLQFFSVGNAMCDAFIRSLSQLVANRTYAVECTANAPEWTGFEFTFQVRGDTGLLGEDDGLQNKLDRFFIFKRERIFISAEGELAENQDQLSKVRKGLNRHNQNEWRNISGDILEQRYGDWQGLAQKLHKKALKVALERFEARIFPAQSAWIKKNQADIHLLKKLKQDGWSSEAASLAALQKAIEGWSIELESAGFLSVNGGILG